MALGGGLSRSIETLTNVRSRFEPDLHNAAASGGEDAAEGVL
jgi:hypothetical protein